MRSLPLPHPKQDECTLAALWLPKEANRKGCRSIGRIVVNSQISLANLIQCSSPFLVGCPMVVNVQISRLCWGP